MNYTNNLEDIAAFLYENKGKGQDGKYLFEEVNAANLAENKMGITPIYNTMDGGRSRQWVSVGDYDKDGYLDLVITGLDEFLLYTMTGVLFIFIKTTKGRDLSDKKLRWTERNLSWDCQEALYILEIWIMMGGWISYLPVMVQMRVICMFI